MVHEQESMRFQVLSHGFGNIITCHVVRYDDHNWRVDVPTSFSLPSWGGQESTTRAVACPVSRTDSKQRLAEECEELEIGDDCNAK